MKPDIHQWLLDSDPSIRWQVMRDLLHAPADEIAAERAKVATEGWGKRLMSLQATDGKWGGAAWNHGWNSTMHALTLLREMGLDPASEETQRAIGLVRNNHRLSVTRHLCRFEWRDKSRITTLL